MILNVGTYNVFGMPWGSKHLHSIILWIFFQSNAEIFCLQEVWSRHHQELIQRLCRESRTWSCYFPYHNSHKLGQWTQRFHSGSGLCILVKNTVDVLEEPECHTFIVMKGVDSFVRKGFMILQCKKDDVQFQVVNTHFQSDMTEIPYWRVRYNETRLKQEKQLFQTVRHLTCPIVVGDLNTEEFMYFECLEKTHAYTFVDTRERLDTCLRSHIHKDLFKKLQAQYLYDIRYSDHIPVLFRLDIVQS
jgi:endonuclease/exonuclease/phosphatase family metal-dependent hydrolase